MSIFAKQTNSKTMETGIKGYQETIVTEENTAIRVGSGSVRVFATPMMIALIEKTASKSIESSLEEGQSSVGTLVNVSHVSATPVGMKVWCETELVEIDRR